MNVQGSLIQEIMLYKFELGCNALEATKNLCCVKCESTVDDITVTRWLKKFCLDFKNLSDQLRSSRPKTVDSESVFQAIEVNLMNSI